MLPDRRAAYPTPGEMMSVAGCSPFASAVSEGECATPLRMFPSGVQNSSPASGAIVRTKGLQFLFYGSYPRSI